MSLLYIVKNLILLTILLLFLFVLKYYKKNIILIINFSKTLNIKRINQMFYSILLPSNNIFEYILYKHYNDNFIIKNINIAIIKLTYSYFY